MEEGAKNKKVCIFALAFKAGSVVQLVRIRACHARGRGFESRPDRQQAKVHDISWTFFMIMANRIIVIYLFSDKLTPFLTDYN